MLTLDAWNATVQHQLSPNISVEVAYVGNKGTHVFPGDGPDYDFNQATIAGFAQGVPHNLRQPFYPKYGWTQNFRYFGNDGNSKYDALQTKIEKRFRGGYSLLAHYTLARALNEDGYYAVDPRVSYGPTDWQRKHVFLLDHVWELPFGKGKKFLSNSSRALNYLVGGWEINGVTPGPADCCSRRPTRTAVPTRMSEFVAPTWSEIHLFPIPTTTSGSRLRGKSSRRTAQRQALGAVPTSACLGTWAVTLFVARTSSIGTWPLPRISQLRKKPKLSSGRSRLTFLIM
jgi:hypothetical protein